ncbi:uncharacterized protein LOC121384261 [Gigantopelta aegis]|uniref:uncharacterized protein LOC121384261 n=1 Tax=Gigantopelta aegis TaxID=1735272 RepID=UPI001B88C84D|nr:uncharacterized protein LOC121384261 [Gigantopelta aegis]
MDFGENYYTDKYQDSEDDTECDVPVVHRAAARGDIETLVQIVQHDPSVLELQKADGFTPLAEAVQAQQICAVKRLVKMGANINAQDNLGRTSLSIAAYQGWHDGVVFLLRNGAKKNTCDTSGRTPLHAATYNKDKRTLSALLSSLSPSELNHEDNEQMTALHWAAFHKRPDHVQELVARGANILATDIDGKLALHWAAQNGCLRSCCVLASVYHANHVINMPDNSGKTPVHYAAAAGHVDIIEYLASRPGCDLEPGDPDERTPLHWAAAMGHADCVTSLLKLGVDPNPLDIDDQTPLNYAVQSGHFGCENLLKASIGTNAVDNGGERITDENPREPGTEQTTAGPIGFFKKLFSPKVKIGVDSPSSDDPAITTTTSPDISIISSNVLVTSDATDKTSVVEELAKSSCLFFGDDQLPVTKPSLYSDIQERCECAVTTSVPGQTDEDMRSERHKMRSDVNKNTCIADDQDSQAGACVIQQRHPRPTIHLHHQSLALPGKKVLLHQPTDNRRLKAVKRSASISGSNVQFTACGSRKLVQSPAPLRKLLLGQSRSQIQLSPGVTRKQISDHSGKPNATFLPDKANKDSDADIVSYLNALDFEEEIMENSPTISRLKQTDDEGRSSTRDPTPPPSNEESYRQVVSSLIRHSISECERYYALPNSQTDGLPRLRRDIDQTFKRGYLNTPLVSIPGDTIISFHNTLKDKDIKPSVEHLLSKRYNVEEQLLAHSSSVNWPSPRRRRRQEKDLCHLDNVSHIVRPRHLPRRKMSPVLQSSLEVADPLGSGEDEPEFANDERGFTPAAKGNNPNVCQSSEKTVTLPVLTVKSGQLLNKDTSQFMGSISVGNSPAMLTRHRRPVKGLVEMDVSSASPRLPVRHGDVSHYK